METMLIRPVCAQWVKSFGSTSKSKKSKLAFLMVNQSEMDRKKHHVSVNVLSPGFTLFSLPVSLACYHLYWES
jgi:hypothetical protein